MKTPQGERSRNFVVYTDLDGTLLDHDDYGFADALPALRRLEQLGVAVVPVTSKTLPELEIITRDLGLKGPCIAENGGLIAFPAGYLDACSSLESYRNYKVLYLSPDYAGICSMLNNLRETYDFDFSGFADMSDARVAELTGLSISAAKLARLRLCSEPLVWNDSDKAFTQFLNLLSERGFTLVKGGRFCHVLGQTDKAQAIKRLDGYLEKKGITDFIRIALGDSPNDIQMLKTADIAVVIRRKDGGWLQLDTKGRKFETSVSGPAGWNEFFQQYLDSPQQAHGTIRTLHG